MQSELWMSWCLSLLYHLGPRGMLWLLSETWLGSSWKILSKMSLLDEVVGTVQMTLSCWTLLHPRHPRKTYPWRSQPCRELLKSSLAIHPWEKTDEDDLLIGGLGRVELLDSSISLCLLTGVLDLLDGVWGSLVVGVSSVGLFWLSGTGINVSIWRCINVIINIKLRRLAWLIRLGRDGKITLPSSDIMVESCPCWSGVLKPSWSRPCWGTLTCWAGTPCRVGSCRVLTICQVGNTWRVLLLCWVGTCRVIHHFRLVHTCRVLIFCRVGNLWQFWLHCRVCRAHHTCRVILCYWSGWRLDDCDSPLLRWFQYGSRQFHISSGNMRWPRLVLIQTLMSSMMILLGQGPVVNRCMRRWRCPRVMVMMSGRRPDIRSPPQSTSWSQMVVESTCLDLESQTVPTMMKVGSAPHSHDAWASDEP